MKTLHSPRASPGKVLTPKKGSAKGHGEGGVISPAKSAKSERSDRSHGKSFEGKQSRKDAHQNLSQSQLVSTEKSSQHVIAPKQIDAKLVKQLNMRLAASACKYLGDLKGSWQP